MNWSIDVCERAGMRAVINLYLLPLHGLRRFPPLLIARLMAGERGGCRAKKGGGEEKEEGGNNILSPTHF